MNPETTGVEDIKILIDPDPDLIDLMPNYVNKRAEEFTTLASLLDAQDYFSIQLIGHKMKGNAALFGLSWLGAKGNDLELAALAKDHTRILELGREMSRFVERVREHLQNGSVSKH